MKKKKLLSAALAAVLTCSSVSAVAFAEDTTEWTDPQGNKWEKPFHILDTESKYNVTVDKVIVNGKEKLAVKISGLSSKMLETNYNRNEYRVDYAYDNNRYSINKRSLSELNITIDIGERFFCFTTDDVDKDFKGAVVTPTVSNVYYPHYRASYFNVILAVATDFDLDLPEYYVQQKQDELKKANARFFETKLERHGNTFDLIGYFEADDEDVKKLISAKETTVATCAHLAEGAVRHYYADGTPVQGGSGGGSDYYLQFTSEDKIIAVYMQNLYDLNDRLLYGINVDEGADQTFGEDFEDVYKEKVKIINNLNAPETSAPTESTVTPGGTDPVSEPDNITNEQTVLEATLKNVDSENGLSGEALDKLLFGDSGWTWEQVEKIVFTSDKLFSVQYTAVDGSTKTLGEKSAQRAEDDGIWNTEWTLDTSLMSKDKSFVKLIAKDGTADIKATIYIKKDAVKPSTGGDQANTGIALAIAPIALAASVVIVASKKKK